MINSAKIIGSISNPQSAHRRIYPYSMNLEKAITHLETTVKSWELSDIPPISKGKRKPPVMPAISEFDEFISTKPHAIDPQTPKPGRDLSHADFSSNKQNNITNPSSVIAEALPENVDEKVLSALKNKLTQVEIEYEEFDGLYHIFKMPNGEKVFYCNKTDKIKPSIKFVLKNSDSVLFIKDPSMNEMEDFEAIENLLNTKIKTSKVHPAKVLRNR